MECECCYCSETGEITHEASHFLDKLMNQDRAELIQTPDICAPSSPCVCSFSSAEMLRGSAAALKHCDCSPTHCPESIYSVLETPSRFWPSCCHQLTSSGKQRGSLINALLKAQCWHPNGDAPPLRHGRMQQRSTSQVPPPCETPCCPPQRTHHPLSVVTQQKTVPATSWKRRCLISFPPRWGCLADDPTPALSLPFPKPTSERHKQGSALLRMQSRHRQPTLGLESDCIIRQSLLVWILPSAHQAWLKV